VAKYGRRVVTPHGVRRIPSTSKAAFSALEAELARCENHDANSLDLDLLGRAARPFRTMAVLKHNEGVDGVREAVKAAVEAAKGRCWGCGAAIGPSRGGRRRKWCSDRCRKATLYSGVCVDCGGATAYSGTATPSDRCVPCATKHTCVSPDKRRKRYARARWSDEELLGILRSLAVDGRITTHMYRKARSENPALPTDLTITKRFDRWNIAVERAGLSPVAPARDNYERITDSALVWWLRQCYAELGGEYPPTNAAYGEWAAKNDAPCAGVLRIRFGTWVNALVAAGLFDG
jgi:hypothetical protein